MPSNTGKAPFRRTIGVPGHQPQNCISQSLPLSPRCMPPAQNSVVILQIAERPDLAGSLAKTLAAVYIFSAGPIAILLSTMLLFATEAEMLWT